MSAVHHHPQAHPLEVAASSADAPSPVDRLAVLACGDAQLPEITQRRRYLADVQRFFGLDIHRDYLVATALDRELRVVAGTIRLA